MSEEERIDEAIRESLMTFKEEESRRRNEKPGDCRNNGEKMTRAVYEVEKRRQTKEDEMLASALQEEESCTIDDEMLAWILHDEESRSAVDAELLSMKLHEEVTEGDEMLARALQESFNSRDIEGLDPSYQRRLEQFMRIERNRDRRIVLLGMTGSGKSSSGNSIVGRTVFKPSVLASSETLYGQHAVAYLQERKVLIVDTPGLFDTRQHNDDTMREIVERVTSSAPHALILVVAGGNRTSEQTQRCAEMIFELFGKQAVRHIVFLFTRLDDITHDGDDLDTFVRSLPPKIKEILTKCGNRYVGFNNRTDSAQMKTAQVNKLLELIDRVVDANGGRGVTSDVSKDFEKMVVAREKDIKEKYELRQKLMSEEVKNKFDKQNQAAKENVEHEIQKEIRKRQEADAKHEAQRKELEYRYKQRIERARNGWS